MSSSGGVNCQSILLSLLWSAFCKFNCNLGVILFKLACRQKQYMHAETPFYLWSFVFLNTHYPLVQKFRVIFFYTWTIYIWLIYRLFCVFSFSSCNKSFCWKGSSFAVGGSTLSTYACEQCQSLPYLPGQNNVFAVVEYGLLDWLIRLPLMSTLQPMIFQW